jgi:hypothetical protein
LVWDPNEHDGAKGFFGKKEVWEEGFFGLHFGGKHFGGKVVIRILIMYAHEIFFHPLTCGSNWSIHIGAT